MGPKRTPRRDIVGFVALCDYGCATLVLLVATGVIEVETPAT